MAQTHRDTPEITVMQLLPYLLKLAREEFYGEVTLKFRRGQVVGHVHEDQDHLVTGLPQMTAAQLAEALKNVTLASV